MINGSGVKISKAGVMKREDNKALIVNHSVTFSFAWSEIYVSGVMGMSAMHGRKWAENFRRRKFITGKFLRKLFDIIWDFTLELRLLNGRKLEEVTNIVFTGDIN